MKDIKNRNYYSIYSTISLNLFAPVRAFNQLRIFSFSAVLNSLLQSIKAKVKVSIQALSTCNCKPFETETARTEGNNTFISCPIFLSSRLAPE